MDDHTHTRIVIRHDTIEALKSHPLWSAIMAAAFDDGPVSVVEIAAEKFVSIDEDD